MQKSEVYELVASCVMEVLNSTNTHPLPDIENITSLIGPKSILDSLELVTLIVNIEQVLQEKFRLTLTLADESAMAQESSPFRTVQSVVDFIWMLIEESRKNDGS